VHALCSRSAHQRLPSHGPARQSNGTAFELDNLVAHSLEAVVLVYVLCKSLRSIPILASSDLTM
jgi:hypothetical protein